MDRNRIPQRGVARPVLQSSPHEADTLYDDGLDDAQAARFPSSAIRYQSYGDVNTETGYTRGDVRVLSSQSYRSNRGDLTGGRSPVPARRTATNIPAIPRTGQPHRRQVQTEDIDVDVDVDDVDEMPTRRLPRKHAQRGRVHWLVFLGGAMFVMVIGWMLLSSLANWWQVTQDDWHYGRPRTYQVDAVVGHNDSLANPSHFIALNLNSHIEVIEFPGGDATKAKVYIGPSLIGQGEDLAPVTLTFQDVNGDGKLDMIVNVGGSHFVYINDSGGFRPARTTDNVHL